MRLIAWDTETALIAPALLAPPMACVTWQTTGTQPQIEAAANALPLVAGWLTDALLVGHNVAFDMAVLMEAYPELTPAIFDAYETDRVTDTMLRAKLLDIAAGCYRGHIGEKGRWIAHEYSLEALAKRYAGIQLQKDAWRLSYSNFLGLPIDAWPARAVEVQDAAKSRIAREFAGQVRGACGIKLTKEQVKELTGLKEMAASDPTQCLIYPLEDARATLAVYQAQEKHASVYLADQYRQARGAFALHLSSAWGIRTDKQGVDILRRETEAQIAEVEAALFDSGLLRKDGSRDTKKAMARMLEVCRRDGLPIRRTDAHTKEGATCGGKDSCNDHVCLDADACKATEDELLGLYAEYSELKKVLTNDVEALAKGTYYPVHTRYDMAETGRTTSSRPNIQNVRRRPGIRECFVPRPGKVFAQADYPQLELYTLAQCCVSWIGHSKLAEALNAGLDPHLAMAAQILGISYEEAKANKKRKDVDNARQTAKVANFGFPGGLGVQKLCLFAKKTYKVNLTIPEAKRLKEQWFATWPEMPSYFARINALCDNESGRAQVESLFTKRFRGGASYCAACNSGFQGLGSDCAKEAAWRIAREQYVDRGTALFNTRTVAFVHDEFILEVDDGPTGHDAAMRLADVMVEGANIYLPDVQIVRAKMEPLLMTRWSKNATPCVDDNGRLIAWAA